MSDLLQVNGKVSAEGVKAIIDADRKGRQPQEVAIIVRATLRATEDVRTSSRGKDRVAKFTLDSAILASGEEADDLLERLAEARAGAKGDHENGTPPLDSPVEDEYSGIDHVTARRLCKERGLNARGSLVELRQRLRENG